MKRVMVTGAGGPASINFIASLKIAPEKIHVVGVDVNRFRIHLAPVDSRFVVPKATEENYISALNEIVRKERVDFIHAQPDIEVRVLSENRDKLDAAVFLPSKEAVRICQDKFETAKILLKRGVPTARAIEIMGEEDIVKAFEEFGRPVWIRAKRGAGGRGSTPAYNLETAVSWIKYWRSRGGEMEFIAQEFLAGRNMAFHSLWKDGEPITSMARERIEYIYPDLAPSGVTGTPAVQRTIRNDEVNKVAVEAVLAIDPNFSGIACVDLKENSEGVPCVTEINAGRMFTTSFFFSYASKMLYGDYRANFPYLYLKMAYGEGIPQLPKFNILPEELYWIRHIDAPPCLVRDDRVLGRMYDWKDA
jgi:carbamoyl-phosphate synthase large subunit